MSILEDLSSCTHSFENLEFVLSLAFNNLQVLVSHIGKSKENLAHKEKHWSCRLTKFWDLLFNTPDIGFFSKNLPCTLPNYIHVLLEGVEETGGSMNRFKASTEYASCCEYSF